MPQSSLQTIILSTIASAIVSAAVSIGTTEYKLRRQQTVSDQQENEEWYSTAANLGRDVRRKWERDFEEHEEHFTSYDEMRSKMKILADQLDNHANEGETLDVDEEIIEKLRNCASACRTLSEVRIGTDREPWIEAGGEIKSEVKELEDAISKYT